MYIHTETENHVQIRSKNRVIIFNWLLYVDDAIVYLRRADDDQ